MEEHCLVWKYKKVTHLLCTYSTGEPNANYLNFNFEPRRVLVTVVRVLLIFVFWTKCEYSLVLASRIGNGPIMSGLMHDSAFSSFTTTYLIGLRLVMHFSQVKRYRIYSQISFFVNLFFIFIFLFFLFCNVIAYTRI